MNHFNDTALKKKILRRLALLAAAFLIGIFAAVFVEVYERMQGTEKKQIFSSGDVQTSAQTACVQQKDEQTKKVALTFDDGPNPTYTELLLDGLKERGVQATFFVLGEEVERYPNIVRRMCREGHLIGVHAYKHVNLRQLSDADAIEQVNRTNEAIYAACGKYASYIRPPYGCWKDDLDYAVQMVEVLWDIDPRDWATTSADLIAARVQKDVEENSIILLHDASNSSVQAAFSIIDTLCAEDYCFVTVEELLLE